MALLFGASVFGQELTLTPYVSGPLGLPSKGDYEVYSTGATLGYNGYKFGYSHSRIFGNSFSAGYYFKKPRVNLSYTYYYNNPYHSVVNPWGSWVSISKTITLWKPKRKKKKRK